MDCFNLNNVVAFQIKSWTCVLADGWSKQIADQNPFYVLTRFGVMKYKKQVIILWWIFIECVERAFLQFGLSPKVSCVLNLIYFY